MTLDLCRYWDMASSRNFYEKRSIGQRSCTVSPHDEKMKAPHPDGPMPHRGSSCCDWCYLLKAKILRLFPSGAREGVL